MATVSLADHLARVPDPRQPSGKRHSLAAVLNLVAVAVMSGMRSLAAIAQLGRSLSTAAAQELGFTHATTPCKSTLSVVLRAVDATRLERELRVWAAQYDDGTGPLALDGKTVRGSAQGETAAVHLLALYAVASGVPLAQTPVADQTNEHKAALALLRQVPLQGRVVTADAMFTHRDVCTTIRGAGGDYVLPAKDNQKTLVRDLQAAFAPEPGLSPPPANRTGRRGATGPGGHQGAWSPGSPHAPHHDAAQ